MCKRLLLVLSLLLTQSSVPALPPIGGPPMQEIIDRKEDILRNHLIRLRKEEYGVRREEAALRRAILQASAARRIGHRAALERRLRELAGTVEDIEEARATVHALWEDQARFARLVEDSVQPRRIATVRPQYNADDFVLVWPVFVDKEISANFMEASYKKFFGIDHFGVDIPVMQGSAVTAAADAIVLEANNRGYGYNSIVLKHEKNLTTVYGHVSKILVQEGDHVSAGEKIALSGGRPGSKGAGVLTTGPHLHFEARVYDVAVDPLYYLPPFEVALR